MEACNVLRVGRTPGLPTGLLGRRRLHQWEINAWLPANWLVSLPVGELQRMREVVHTCGYHREVRWTAPLNSFDSNLWSVAFLGTEQLAGRNSGSVGARWTCWTCGISSFVASTVQLMFQSLFMLLVLLTLLFADIVALLLWTGGL